MLLLTENDGLIFVVVLQGFNFSNFLSSLVYKLNNRFLRERGMASNPNMEYQVFLVT